MVTDTEFLISVSKRDPDALSKLPELEDENVAVKLPAMAILEFFVGELGATQFKKMKGDAAIAATVDVEVEPVLTRNVDDFERLGVEVEPH